MLGVRTVAVYSDADKDCLHVEMVSWTKKVADIRPTRRTTLVLRLPPSHTSSKTSFWR